MEKMNDMEIDSCKVTITMLKAAMFVLRGRIDVIDKLNCAKIVALLESQRSSQEGEVHESQSTKNESEAH